MSFYIFDGFIGKIMTNIPANNKLIKGRGAQNNPPIPFHKEIRTEEHLQLDENRNLNLKTKYIETNAKTIVNKIDSPDIGLNYGINPYQGCEHGCSYCYARNTHTYWGYSAGLDFESVILVKKNAPKLLREKFQNKYWSGDPIMLSGNTDCYQPIERRLKITRALIKLFWEYKNPIGIITKNSLILRDIDLLRKMSEERLLKVSVSLNTLDESLRQKLEPRTSSVSSRLKLIEILSEYEIPVNVMIAPIIPGINHHEIHNIMEEVALRGAKDAKYIVIRLNGDVRKVFEKWLYKAFPERSEKVMSRITSLHGGRPGDSRFGIRMKGEGKWAEILNQQYQLAKRSFFHDREMPEFDLSLFHKYRNPQLSLF